MRFLAASLIVLMCAVGAQAQEPSPGCAPAPQERVGEQRRHPRLVVVVDTSGSMQGPRLAEAVAQALEIVGQPTDGLDVAVITFNDRVTRIGPALDDPWYRLPDGDAVDGLRSALTSIPGGGGTHPAAALRQALDMDAVSVLLFTDGEFGSDPTAAIQEAQADGGPELVLFAIGNSERGREALQKLAEDTGALMWERAEPREPREPQERRPPAQGGRDHWH